MLRLKAYLMLSVKGMRCMGEKLLGTLGPVLGIIGAEGKWGPEPVMPFITGIRGNIPFPTGRETVTQTGQMVT